MSPFRIAMALLFISAASALIGKGEGMAQQGGHGFLRLEAKIPLGNVRGRLDHLAVDLKRGRLFVAELGNNSVGVVDFTNRKLVRTISGLREPQGVAYLPRTDTLYVANGGDGSVRLFRGTDYASIGRIDLGEDADNIRVDTAGNRIYVGYGDGAVAVIDPSNNRRVGVVRLKAHPEGFQLATKTKQVFVNLPDAQTIAVIDRGALNHLAQWPTHRLNANFPMALDEERRHVLVGFRRPAELGVFSMADGSLVVTMEICGDADDIFVDPKRQRVYVSCGEGFVDVFDARDIAYRRIARIRTISGARTSLFVPALNLLLLAARASSGQQAAIWVFRPGR